MSDDLTEVVQSLFGVLRETGMWPNRPATFEARRAQAEVVVADFLWENADPRDVWPVAKAVCARIASTASSEAERAGTAERLRREIADVIRQGLAITPEPLLAS